MTEKKRKRPSRRQASKKSVWGWLFFRPRFLKGAIRVGRLALFLWSLWHKLKDDPVSYTHLTLPTILLV